MAKSAHVYTPYTFRSRTVLILLLCSLVSGFFAFSFSYVVSRTNIQEELSSSEQEIAIYLLELAQKTSLSEEDMLRMAASETLTTERVVNPSDRLSAGDMEILENRLIFTETDGYFGLPMTYVYLNGSVVLIRPVRDFNIVTMAGLRVIFSATSFLLIFGLMGTIAAGKIAKPVSMLTRATKRVAEGDFAVYLPECGGGEVGELMRSFNAMTEALSSTSYLQKDFISNISHEFRTPIASIKGFARLLQMPGLDENTRQDYINMIAQESDRLSRLSTTLLRLASLEQQTSPASLSTFRLDEQMRQVILNLEPVWSAKNIDWQLTLDPVTLTSDEELLTQVWINLIQNAVKFSPNDSIIEIRCYETDAAVAEVTDHGIGMSEETVNRIFERFYQADKSRSKDGIGLGLCLVKRILDMLGGTIRVRSVLDQGSTFSVRLPKQAKGGQKEDKAS